LIKYSKFRKFLVRRAIKDSLNVYINLTMTVAAGSSRCKSGLYAGTANISSTHGWRYKRIRFYEVQGKLN